MDPLKPVFPCGDLRYIPGLFQVLLVHGHLGGFGRSRKLRSFVGLAMSFEHTNLTESFSRTVNLEEPYLAGVVRRSKAC